MYWLTLESSEGVYDHGGTCGQLVFYSSLVVIIYEEDEVEVFFKMYIIFYLVLEIGVIKLFALINKTV
jgi:hypothetical protein